MGDAIQIQRGSTPLPPDTAVCIGAFDGLHVGHRALFSSARRHARRVALLTFDPHPQAVLAPDRPLALLLDARQRARTAAASGVDHLVLLSFDRDLAALPPADFVERHLVPLRPARVLVGADFRFGAGRRGDAAMLRSLLGARGIEVDVVRPVASADEAPRVAEAGTESIDAAHDKIGSRRIREALAAGDVALARQWLGRPHAVLGSVVTGDRRGRTIGVPTANVATTGLLPERGVYTVWLTVVGDDGGPMPGVANIGINPTFAGTRALRLEVHVIDRELGESLYGREVEVWFVDRIRGEAQFPGVEALVAAIHADIAEGRERLVDAEADGVLPPPAMESP
jgi:riboflavin kinase/FMN adenylyltransferase